MQKSEGQGQAATFKAKDKAWTFEVKAKAIPRPRTKPLSIQPKQKLSFALSLTA